MKTYIATNGEIIAPVTYGIDVFDPQDLPRDAVTDDNGDIAEPAYPGTLLHGKDEWVPIEARFTPEFVATLREYDPVTEPEPPELAQPEPPAPTPPTVVTMKQARLALLAAGKYKAVQDTITGLGGDKGDAARIEWEFSPTVERESDLVRSLSAALDLDDAALDSLFAAAAKL